MNEIQEEPTDNPYQMPVEELKTGGKSLAIHAREQVLKDAKDTYRKEKARKQMQSQNLGVSNQNGIQNFSSSSSSPKDAPVFSWNVDSQRTRQKNGGEFFQEISQKIKASMEKMNRLKLVIYGILGSFGFFLLISVLIAFFAVSPFGIFFTGEACEQGAIPLSSAMHTINEELNAKLEPLQHEKEYDAVYLTGDVIDWMEVLAVFAVEDENQLVYALSTEDVQELSKLYWSMVSISSKVKNVPHAELVTTYTKEGKPIVGFHIYYTKELYVDISCMDARTMAQSMNLSEKQLQAMEEILSLHDTLYDTIGSLSILDSTAKAAVIALPLDLETDRYQVMKQACSLCGKVSYFWGGKSFAHGWDSRWGQLRKVTSSGSEDTGIYKPFGLDCTGYVNWVFYNALGKSGLSGTEIPIAQAKIGDLVYTENQDHVGLVLETDKYGPTKVIHCAKGLQGVGISDSSIFTHAVLPDIYEKGELQ